MRYNTIFRQAPNESVYAYTAIFAPTGLSMSVSHEWQRYDEEGRTWVTEETIPFFIVGGRDGGYRGYSIKSGATEGTWRVNVITEFRQLIGRVSFRVENVDTPVPVEAVVR